MADNDYEREREERIARNKAMLEQLQVAGTAQSMGSAAKSASDRKRKAPAKNSMEPGTGTPSRRSSRSGAAAARLKIKASVPEGGSSSDEDDDDDDDDEERPSSSRKRRKADLDDFYDPSDNGSSDEEGEEEEEEEAAQGRRPSGKRSMMGNKGSARARGGASRRDTRGGSTALAAPARMSYQSHMKNLAGRKNTDEEEVDAAIARAVAAAAVRRSPPVGTNAPADAVDGGRAPTGNRKASTRSRGAQMAAMAAGRKTATGKGPVVEEEEDEDELLEVSSGTGDEEDQDAAEDTDLQRAIAMSLGASDEGAAMRTEGQHSQEEAVAAGGSGGEEGRWAELPPEDISVRRVKRASGTKGANSSRPDVPEEGWKRVFLHLSHGRSTVTAKDIQKVSADLGHPAGDMDDDTVSMMLRRASELTGNGSSCLRMAEFLDLADKMQASAK